MLIRCIKTNSYFSCITKNKIYNATLNEGGHEYTLIKNNGDKCNSCSINKFEIVTDIRIGDILTIRNDLEVTLDDNITETMIQFRGIDVRIIDIPDIWDGYYNTDKTGRYHWSLKHFIQTSKESVGELEPTVDIFDLFNK